MAPTAASTAPTDEMSDIPRLCIRRPEKARGRLPPGTPRTGARGPVSEAAGRVVNPLYVLVDLAVCILAVRSDRLAPGHLALGDARLGLRVRLRRGDGRRVRAPAPSPAGRPDRVRVPAGRRCGLHRLGGQGRAAGRSVVVAAAPRAHPRGTRPAARPLAELPEERVERRGGDPGAGGVGPQPRRDRARHARAARSLQPAGRVRPLRHTPERAPSATARARRRRRRAA